MIRKLYARFWLWKNDYCRHGVKREYEYFHGMVRFEGISCLDCEAQSISRHRAEAQRKAEKKNRMLEAL